MDFDFSDEQRMLKESVEQLITDRYSFEQRKQYMKEAAGYSPAMWAQYAEMGLLGLPFDERHGGVGGWGGQCARDQWCWRAFVKGVGSSACKGPDDGQPDTGPPHFVANRAAVV